VNAFAAFAQALIPDGILGPTCDSISLLTGEIEVGHFDHGRSGKALGLSASNQR
jgi:hypothetical protein